MSDQSEVPACPYGVGIDGWGSEMTDVEWEANKTMARGCMCESCESHKKQFAWLNNVDNFLKQSKLFNLFPVRGKSRLYWLLVMDRVVDSIRDPVGTQVVRKIGPNTFEVRQCPSVEQLRGNGLVRTWAFYINESPKNRFVCKDNTIVPI